MATKKRLPTFIQPNSPEGERVLQTEGKLKDLPLITSMIQKEREGYVFPIPGKKRTWKLTGKERG